jgi:glutamyl-tRNA synthetase
MYRFAISPLENIDINTFVIALLNYLCAKKENIRFLVRINDGTNVKNQANTDEILDTLASFGINYDALFYQSQNRKFYHQCAAQLLTNAKAFSCFCTDEDLQSNPYDGKCEKLSNEEVLNNESPFTIRIKKPNESIIITDFFKTKSSFDPQSVDSFIILNHDKSPTNDFATAIDDMLQGVSFVIQNDALSQSIPKQEHIRQSLGYTDKITFASLEPIPCKGGQIYTIKWLLDEGFLPQAIANYLLLLDFKAPCEIFTIQEALEWFDFSSILASKEQFDLERLRQINSKHIGLLDPTYLGALLDFSGEDFGKIAKLFLNQAPTLKELKPLVQAIFAPKIAPIGFENQFQILKKTIQNAKYFEDFTDFKIHLETTTKLEGEDFNKPLYALLVGTHDGPKLEALYPLIKNYLKEIIR